MQRSRGRKRAHSNRPTRKEVNRLLSVQPNSQTILNKACVDYEAVSCLLVP